MIFTEQHVTVIGPGGEELDAGEWSGAMDEVARDAGGYVVINSSPPRILADYRDAGPQTRTMPPRSRK